MRAIATSARLRACIVPGAIAVAAYLLLFVALYARNHGDVSRFIVAGDAFANRAAVPACISVAERSGGYDGQFFFRMAIAPLTTVPEVAGIRFDYPVYRQQRIGYPLAASLLTLGNPCRAPWALIGVNLIAIAALGAAGGAILASLGAPAWYGAILALYPGFIFTFNRDLAEILAVALILLGVHLLARGHHIPFALVMSAAALTRETSLIAAVVCGVVAVVAAYRKGEHRIPAAFALVLPASVWLEWKTFLFHLWNTGWNSGAGGALSWLPLRGLIHAIRTASSAATPVALIELGLLAALVVIWMPLVARMKKMPDVRSCSVVYFAFVLMLGPGIWIEDAAFLRALSEFVIFALLVLLSNARLRRPVAFVTTAAWIALAVDVVRYR